ncbi:hypothetical protein PCC7424_4998 [Gloeothece citriformis PCC 7424]|uniref:Uncharacterized protein n=1 Tax=Gloeothece citriformis (strain PCC 7424) TaxID=65393 RepID=B7KFM6_GLOC7|nr:hypothetical protein PCC7424_4998 [Gloeothece citriformis PCC 7424]
MGFVGFRYRLTQPTNLSESRKIGLKPYYEPTFLGFILEGPVQ